MRMSLEDIFLQLTTERRAGGDAPSGRGARSRGEEVANA